MSKYWILLFVFFKATVTHASVIYYDRAHGQAPNRAEAIEIVEGLGSAFVTHEEPITSDKLSGVDALYLRAPRYGFLPTEIKAIIEYVKSGGSLFVIIDEERRQQLEVVKVNELLEPFGMMYTQDTPYLHNTGAIAPAGEINPEVREIPYSGGRAVAGGNAFAYRLNKDGTMGVPAGAWKQLENGAKIVVMGEGMPAIFMGVEAGERLTGVDRNPRETIYWGADSYAFMQDVFAWLLKL